MPIVKKRKAPQGTYTLMHELMASATQPMPIDFQRAHLGRMAQSLANIERLPTPSAQDWRVVSDAVNFMETLITNGPWRMADGDWADVQDANNLLHDAIAAMAIAGARHLQEGKPIRLDGPGIVAVRGLLEDYTDMVSTLPHRSMVQAHRQTEKRLMEINSGKRKPHDIEVVRI